MVQHRKFMSLALDDEGLHTPDGTLRLGSITRVEAVRTRSRSGGGVGSSASPAGIIGGALVGGAIGGPVGMLGGGLLGSTVRRPAPAPEGPPRTTSVTLVFESPGLAYTTTVGRERVVEAEAFVAAVKAAAGL